MERGPLYGVELACLLEGSTTTLREVGRAYVAYRIVIENDGEALPRGTAA